MLKIKNIPTKMKFLINSLYYFKHSFSKNTYPYRLIGEKIYHLESGKIVMYKSLGCQNDKEILLQNLLNNKKLIERFRPADAFKLGSMAFEEIILSLNQGERERKFTQIKNAMLNSIHDIYPKKELADLRLHNTLPDNESNNNYLDVAVTKNRYPCKLAGGEINTKRAATIITFTIFGKRDGYEKSLHELCNNKELLAKFHPTEAIKFGFISIGDSLFLPLDSENK